MINCNRIGRHRLDSKHTCDCKCRDGWLEQRDERGGEGDMGGERGNIGRYKVVRENCRHYIIIPSEFAEEY